MGLAPLTREQDAGSGAVGSGTGAVRAQMMAVGLPVRHGQEDAVLEGMDSSPTRRSTDSAGRDCEKGSGSHSGDLRFKGSERHRVTEASGTSSVRKPNEDFT